MNLKLSNLGKPSEPTWKKFGDFALFSIPIILPSILALPISASALIWILPIAGIILSLVKIISKYTIDPNFKDDDTSTDFNNTSKLA